MVLVGGTENAVVVASLLCPDFTPGSSGVGAGVERGEEGVWFEGNACG